MRASLKIAYIDTDPLVGKLVRAFFKRCRARLNLEAFDCVGRAVEHLEQHSSSKPDVIFLDADMAKSACADFIISSRHSNPDVPILIVATPDQTKEVATAIAAGAAAWIDKSPATFLTDLSAQLFARCRDACSGGCRLKAIAS